ncbi:DUF6624 domain-containing protein [Streptomyces bauhiniae]|uniref:DUF6624 domain-containing protein n=1 Tax=Streptomyces bauhiniae TaxID=2340725 RepID=UPI0035DE3DAD
MNVPPPQRPSLARELLARAARAAETWAQREKDQLDGVQLWTGRHDDYANGNILRRVIAEHGWPGHRVVGPDAAHAAWRLAMHADDLPHLQAVAARLMLRAAEGGDAPLRDWAHLHDRALLNCHGLQNFGTQYWLSPTGPKPCPVHEPYGLDTRRADIGLPPAAEALAAVRARLAPNTTNDVTATIALTVLAVAA